MTGQELRAAAWKRGQDCQTDHFGDGCPCCSCSFIAGAKFGYASGQEEMDMHDQNEFNVPKELEFWKDEVERHITLIAEYEGLLREASHYMYIQSNGPYDAPGQWLTRYDSLKAKIKKGKTDGR